MAYIGRVFRPPSEADSVIVQATVGCSHNGCRFCDMYKEKGFRVRPVRDTIADLTWMSRYVPGARRVFLGDGDAMMMQAKDLTAILSAVSARFPFCTRVSCYATPKSILVKSPAELSALRENGLSMVYLGLESGDDVTLKAMGKGARAAEIVKAGQMVRAAGMNLSVTAISGLGGTARISEHALATADALSAMNPEYIGLLTLRAEGQAPLVQDIASGKFVMLTPEQIAQETRLLIEHIDSPGSVFRANHILNYLNLAGTLNADKAALIKTLDRALDGQLAFKSEALRTWDLRH